MGLGLSQGGGGELVTCSSQGRLGARPMLAVGPCWTRHRHQGREVGRGQRRWLGLMCCGGFMGKVMLQGSSTPALAQNCAQHRAISRTRWPSGPRGLSGRGQPAAVSHCIHLVPLLAAFVLEEALGKGQQQGLLVHRNTPGMVPFSPVAPAGGIASECSAGISRMAKAGRMLQVHLCVAVGGRSS